MNQHFIDGYTNKHAASRMGTTSASLVGPGWAQNPHLQTAGQRPDIPQDVTETMNRRWDQVAREPQYPPWANVIKEYVKNRNAVDTPRQLSVMDRFSNLLSSLPQWGMQEIGKGFSEWAKGSGSTPVAGTPATAATPAPTTPAPASPKPNMMPPG